MAKLVFKQLENDDWSSRTELKMTSRAETLTEVLRDFNEFLRGCGYYFEGQKVGMVDDTPENERSFEDRIDALEARISELEQELELDEVVELDGLDDLDDEEEEDERLREED